MDQSKFRRLSLPVDPGQLGAVRGEGDESAKPQPQYQRTRTQGGVENLPSPRPPFPSLGLLGGVQGQPDSGLGVTGGAPLPLQKLQNAQVQRLGQGDQQADVGKPGPPLPLAYRPVRDVQPAGQLPLGKTLGLPDLSNQRAGFLPIHLYHLPQSIPWEGGKGNKRWVERPFCYRFSR